MSYLFQGKRFSIGEEPSEGSYVVAGKGVTFLEPSGGEEHTVDVYMQYIAGGLLRVGGSYRFYNKDFTDQVACYNFDDDGDGSNQSKSRKGNSHWGVDNKYAGGANGGELIAEIRLKKSQYPQVKELFNGIGQETGGGGYHVGVGVFTEGEYAYGQHGRCNSDGSPEHSGYSKGHKVPNGWIYVQVRMTYVMDMSANGNKYSPRIFMGVRMSQDGIGC